ncbi:MAG: M48 family metalloprotease [Bryobacteraceae bacterium]
MLAQSACLLRAQAATPAPDTQATKELVLGAVLAKNIDQRDGRLNNAAISNYVQQLENELALASATSPLQVRITKATEQYAILLPGRILYLSSGLLLHLESESELAAVLAHEQAHAAAARNRYASNPGSIPLLIIGGDCVLSSPAMPFISPPSGIAQLRQAEVEANTMALRSLRSAHYDPVSLFSVLSKLAYEHPGWVRALVPSELETGLSEAEAEPLPAKEYITNTSAFAAIHDNLAGIMGVFPPQSSVKVTRAPTLMRDP